MKLDPKYFAPWGGYFEKTKEGSHMAEVKQWTIEDEAAHKGIKCAICIQKMGIGNRYAVTNENPFTITHVSCVENKTQEEVSMKTKAELQKMTMEQLVKLYNGKVKSDKAVKKFADKETAIVRILALDKKPGAKDMIHCPGEQKMIPFAGCETRQGKEKNRCTKDCDHLSKDIKKKVKKSSGPGRGRTLDGGSKMGKIRAAFAEKKSWSAAELMKKSGYDRANLQCAMSILQNPNRTKEANMVVTEYDKEKEIFTLAKK